MSEPVEKPLKGGQTTPVSRLGDHVLRESGPWTATVQKLLAHLRDAGVNWCPEPQGFAADGRETVSYLRGKVPNYPLPEWVFDEEVLVTSAKWLRQFHDATVTFDSSEFTWRAPRHSPAEVVCHNDFAPYNFVFRDHKLVGVIDWDFASPGPRIWDLAYLAYRMVPLQGPDNPDAPTTPKNLMGRLRLLLEAYGSDASVPELLRTVVARLEELADFTRGQAKVAKHSDFLDQARAYDADAAFLAGLLP